MVSLLSGEIIDKMASNYKIPIIPFNNVTNHTVDNTTLINQYKVSVACSLSLLVGVIQLLMGFCGLGFLTSFFSEAFVSSYTSASAIHVLTSQIKDLFGIKNAQKYEGLFKIPKVLQIYFHSRIATKLIIIFISRP